MKRAVILACVWTAGLFASAETPRDIRNAGRTDFTVGGTCVASEDGTFPTGLKVTLTCSESRQ